MSKPTKQVGRNVSSTELETRALRGGTSPTSADDLAVSLHSMQEQLNKLQDTQKSILAHQRESDLHAERLDAKLDSIGQAIVKIDRKLATT